MLLKHVGSGYPINLFPLSSLFAIVASSEESYWMGNIIICMVQWIYTCSLMDISEKSAEFISYGANCLTKVPDCWHLAYLHALSLYLCLYACIHVPTSTNEQL